MIFVSSLYQHQVPFKCTGLGSLAASTTIIFSSFFVAIGGEQGGQLDVYNASICHCLQQHKSLSFYREHLLFCLCRTSGIIGKLAVNISSFLSLYYNLSFLFLCVIFESVSEESRVMERPIMLRLEQ